MSDPQTLGQVIRAQRKVLGLTQEELAERIGDGVRQAEVSRLESDRITLPRRHRLERIAYALGMSVGELLARAGWAGAAEALDPLTSSTFSATVAASHAPQPSKTVVKHVWSGTAGLEEKRRQLRDALAESAELRHKSAHLLQESMHTAALWAGGGRVVDSARDGAS